MIPAIDMVAKAAAANVYGIFLRKPDSSFTSRVPVSWSILPTTIKSVPLYRACAKTKTMAACTATVVPMPKSITIMPRALTVVYASIFFKSVCMMAFTAPKTMVKPPTTGSKTCHNGNPLKIGERRASKKIPALTMEVECR